MIKEIRHRILIPITLNSISKFIFFYIIQIPNIFFRLNNTLNIGSSNSISKKPSGLNIADNVIDNEDDKSIYVPEESDIEASEKV